MIGRVSPTLRERVAYWTSQGYRVISETESSAQLVRPKRFNPIEFIAMPIYALEYFGQRERQVNLAVGKDGRVTESGSGVERSRYRRMQDQPPLMRLLSVVLILGVPTLVIVVLLALFR